MTGKAMTDETENPESVEDAPHAVDDESTTAPMPRWRRPLIIAVLVAAVAVTAVHFGWRPDSKDEPRLGPTSSATLPPFVDQVETHVVELLSYTPRNVKTRLQTESAYLTDKFAEAFDRLTRTVIAPDTGEHDVTVKAKAVDSGLSSMGDGEAELLVFVETTTTSSRLAEPRIDGARLRVSVVEVDGEWLISELDPV